MLSARGRRDRGGRRVDPDASPDLDRPGARLTDEVARDLGRCGQAQPGRHRGRSTSSEAHTAYTEGDADLTEINPLILKPTGEVHALDARSPSTTTPGSSPRWAGVRATQVRDERGPRGRTGACSTSASTARSASSPTAPGSPCRPSAMSSTRPAAGRQLPRHRRRRQRGRHGRRPRVINNDPSVKAIFINIFGGITRGEEVANGIVEALGRVHRRADRHPPRRHQRRGGPGDPSSPPVRASCRCSPPCSRPARGRRARPGLSDQPD